MNKVSKLHATNFSNLNFRKLMVSDLHLMHKWLNTDFVSQWYGQKNYSYEEILQKYSAKISTKNPANPFLILYAHTPIDYIQSYRISDYPDYNKFNSCENPQSEQEKCVRLVKCNYQS